MKDYKELIGDIEDCLIAHPSESASKMYLRKAADAIEQLVKERDAAVKCIEDIETYLQMGSAKYIDKTISRWRGVQE